MPKDGEIHQCELLKYFNRYLYYVKSKHGASRWRFIVPKDSTGTDDMDYLGCVLFCPCCGLDLRPDTGEGAPGRPELERLLKKAGVKS